MMKSFKNKRALSPVVAAIILIAVTVAVAVAATAWLGSMSFSFMKTEEINIGNQAWASDMSYIDLTARNYGTDPITIRTVEVNNEAVDGFTFRSGSATLRGGESAVLRVTDSFVSGVKYQFWVVTSSGAKFPCVASAPATSVSVADWWDSSYDYRKHVTVTNNMASTLSSGYSVCLTMDTSALVSGSKMLPDGDDLRVVYWDGASFTELDRDIIDMNTDSTQIWFKTQVDISSGGTDDSYDLYYGYPSAESPLENRGNVYLWYDNFNRANNPDITTEADYSVKTNGGTWSIESNTLKNVGASGDPNKLIITALGPVTADVDMLAKINVDSFTGGDASRVGLSVCMNDPSSRGSGYCALFHDNTDSLDFLNDLRSWGTQPTYSWSLDTWYYMRFRVIDTASKLGQVKVWTVGTSEPGSWTVDGNFGSGAAR
ncbi:MAG: archaellin/type IV pilin N-terminal domain-containing protein, partial [bacterium]